MHKRSPVEAARSSTSGKVHTKLWSPRIARLLSRLGHSVFDVQSQAQQRGAVYCLLCIYIKKTILKKNYSWGLLLGWLAREHCKYRLRFYGLLHERLSGFMRHSERWRLEGWRRRQSPTMVALQRKAWHRLALLLCEVMPRGVDLQRTIPR